MESSKRMNNYIKDFHYKFQTKNVTLNYCVAETDDGNSYLPIVLDPEEVISICEFLKNRSCISYVDFDPHRQDDVIIDVYFKYDTADTSIRKICSEAIQMIKEIADNKKEEC